MVTYMTMPWNKLTLGATDLVNTLTSAKVNRIENGFDTATIVLPSTSYYPSTVTQGTAVSLAVKDETDTSYTTIFSGIVRFVIADISEKNSLTLSCLGAGYAYGEMLVGSDYGSQSSNGLDTITEIITDSTDGINDKYVEKILGGASSGYNYDTSLVETISDSIPYINFPYKPANQCFNDLMDLVTAYKAGSAGPHWIVTTDSKLLVKLLTSSVTGWTKYYGNSQANATLTYGVDYTNINLEKMAAEANLIVYYGNWRRPSNGDYWTEDSSTLWDDGTAITLSDYSTNHMVNDKSLKVTLGLTTPDVITYPVSGSLAWDFSIFNANNFPSISFYALKHAGANAILLTLETSSGNNFYTSITIDSADTWQHYDFPVSGPDNTGATYKPKNSSSPAFKWSVTGSPNWNSINAIKVQLAGGDTDYILLDGLHIGGAAVCRVAQLSSYSGVSVKQRLIVDDVGKDDSLIDGDDSGLMAKLAYSELLRQNTSSTVGTVVTKMIKDLLPGQWLYIQSTDYRATKITQSINEQGYTSTIEVTTDITNGRARTRYEDLNKQFAAIRPEWQDRQASNIKAGSVDWQITRLTKSY